MVDAQPLDRAAVHAELDDAREAFHRLLDCAGPTELRRPTDGTRWNNEQLLFHILLGYLIIRPLLVVGKVFARLPRGADRAYARLLNAATGPFDFANYLGSVVGAKVYSHRRMGTRFDRVIAGLHRRLDADSDDSLNLAMHYPARWDPFFTDVMTRADVYRYPTRHFEFHARQLTLRDQI